MISSQKPGPPNVYGYYVIVYLNGTTFSSHIEVYNSFINSINVKATSFVLGLT